MKKVTIRFGKDVENKIEEMRGRKTVTRFCHDVILAHVEHKHLEAAAEKEEALSKLKSFDPERLENLLFEIIDKMHVPPIDEKVLLLLGAIAAGIPSAARELERSYPEMYKRFLPRR